MDSTYCFLTEVLFYGIISIQWSGLKRVEKGLSILNMISASEVYHGSFSGNILFQNAQQTRSFTAVLSNDVAWGTDSNPHFQRPTKSVYLLHGFSGCDTDWFVNAPLGEIANRFNVNFFLPNGDNNFYLDQPQTGCKYASYVGKEFVEYTRKKFGLSDKREDTAIGGLSMGGFGSLHTAFLFPETFGKVIALSSALIQNGLSFFKPDMENGMAN